MDIDLVDYAFFDIIQLRTLYKYYERDLDKYSNLHEESQRYAEIYKARRPGNSISKVGAISATGTTRQLFPKSRLYFLSYIFKNEKVLFFIKVMNKV